MTKLDNIVLWDQHCSCSLSLTKMSLCSAQLYFIWEESEMCLGLRPLSHYSVKLFEAKRFLFSCEIGNNGKM
jgi:hypothetical protein